MQCFHFHCQCGPLLLFCHKTKQATMLVLMQRDCFGVVHVSMSSVCTVCRVSVSDQLAKSSEREIDLIKLRSKSEPTAVETFLSFDVNGESRKKSAAHTQESLWNRSFEKSTALERKSESNKNVLTVLTCPASSQMERAGVLLGLQL